jgi:hypothetical protein
VTSDPFASLRTNQQKHQVFVHSSGNKNSVVRHAHETIIIEIPYNYYFLFLLLFPTLIKKSQNINTMLNSASSWVIEEDHVHPGFGLPY